MSWIDLVVQDVAELDYNSPEGQPDVMLVKASELRAILESRDPMAPDMTTAPEIAKALRGYQQGDADGVMVLVSRQACDEGAALIERAAGLAA